MSFANAPGPRGFDIHDLSHLNSIPELACESMFQPVGVLRLQEQDITSTTLGINLSVYQNDAVDEVSITITDGRPTANSVLQNLDGDYSLEIKDINGSTLWSQAFGLYFDYNGPVFLGIDYSSINYDALNVSYRVPYTSGMSVIELYHNQEMIFSKEILHVYLPFILRTN